MVGYDADYYRGREAITWEVLKEVERAVPRLVPGNVLDVAAGMGRHAHLLRWHGFDVTTVDLVDAKTPQHEIADFLKWDARGRAWDNVVSFHFIEHLPLPVLKEALAKMRKVTRSRAVLVMPHPRHRDYTKDPTHAGVPLREIRAAVESAFTTVREERYHNLVPHDAHHPYAWTNLARRIANPMTFTNVMFVADVPRRQDESPTGTAIRP